MDLMNRIHLSRVVPTLLLAILLSQAAYAFDHLFTIDNNLNENAAKTLVAFDVSSGQDALVFQLTHDISIYGRLHRKLTVFKNGLVALDDVSVEALPSNYPADTQINGQRLQQIHGRYLSAFSSVNDGPTGTVTIKEITPVETQSLSCVNKLQIERIQRLIQLRYSQYESTDMQSIIWMRWENMTNQVYGYEKTNSYSLVIFNSGSKSYAIIQYMNLEWPDKDEIVSDALPPEAGIYISPSDGYQLPRSGHSVNTAQWMSESNVVLPGQWLVPLYDAPVEDTNVLEWLPKVIDEFKTNITMKCSSKTHSMNFLHTERIVKRVSKNKSMPEILNDSSDFMPRLTASNETEWSHHDNDDRLDYDQHEYEDENDVMSGEQFWNMYKEDGEQKYDEDESSTQSINPIVGDGMTFSSTYETVEPLIVPVTAIPLGINDGDETRTISNTEIPIEYSRSVPNESIREMTYSPDFSPVQTESCDPRSECQAKGAECYRVADNACCVCPRGFYGAGNMKCLPNEIDYSFAFSGHLMGSLTNEAQAFNYPLYLDIQNGRSKRSSSGMRGVPFDEPGHQTLRLLSPMFHILNGLISTTCDSHSKQKAAYNVFTLANAFQSPFKLQFIFDIEHVGQIKANVFIELSLPISENFARGTLNIELITEKPINLTQRAYRELSNIETATERIYFASYSIDNHGRIIFPKQSVHFVAESRAETRENSITDQLTVQWSAMSEVIAEQPDMATGSCLLHPRSPLPRDDKFYLRLLDRGYCSEDCSSPDNTCNMFCVDMPLLYSYEPDACSCINCQSFGEICVTSAGVYACQCKPGFRRMDDQTCQASGETPIPDIPYPKENCGPLTCHEYARCIDPQLGFCQCKPGYRGDGNSRCEEDPCSRCKQNEICMNDVCRPSDVDLCEDIRCGKQAFCRDGACNCNPGYAGDPMTECFQERELCAGVQCHRFGQCYQNRCYCSHGYVGDGVNFCDVHTVDPCDGVRCTNNAICRDGQCTCEAGYEGDGYSECRQIQDACANVQCHANADCQNGQCRCKANYEGDGYQNCQLIDMCAHVRCHPDAECKDGQCSCRSGFQGDGYYDCHRTRSDKCVDQDCHSNAYCVENRCVCKPGYEGDGYKTCSRTQPVETQNCGKCRGVPLRELAQCIDNKCVCVPGFIQTIPGVCMECVQANCHQDAVCRPTAHYNGAFSCQCKTGFEGDGVISCQRGATVDSTCGGGCQTQHSECNLNTGQCECRHGYDGDGRTYCKWNCQLCHENAICDRENQRCNCKPGYHGDGKAYCEPIPHRPDPIKVHITGQGDVHRVFDLDKSLTLHCFVTTYDNSVTGQWLQPKNAQVAQIAINRVDNGTELVLSIVKPALNDAGRYYCRAGQVEAFIDVVIEETAVPYDIFLTSDDGILKLRSGGKSSLLATLWNLAENNKYGRVAMVTDCNSQRVIYTSDYGHSVRWGDANSRQRDLVTNQLFQSQISRIRYLIVDPPSGNIFAWDEAVGKIVVMNPSKPHMRYTLEAIKSLSQDEHVRLTGLAVQSNKGLLYWASFTDGWMPNGTIQVASMTGHNEAQLLQLSGEPLALSLSPSYDNTDNSAGRICWIQRSVTNLFALNTEMHCARLSANGREVVTQERLRQFTPTEEPSWGLIHHRGTILWTDASKPVYFSINPVRRVHVRLVCCSNRFQSIAALSKCNPSMNNPCSYSNGRCAYFCLPNEDQRSRTCVCPDSEIGCHKHI